MIGGIVQELEIPSARVLFEWKSLDHVAIEETHAPVTGVARLLPRQLDRRRRGRRPARLRPEHVGRLQDRPPDGRGDLAARRQEERLRDGEGHASSRGSTTRASSEGGRDARIFDDGAQPAVAPQSRALVLALDHVNRRATLVAQVHAPARPHPLEVHGQRAARSTTATCSSAGAASRSSPSSARSGGSASTRSCRTAARTTARSASRGTGRPTDKPRLVRAAAGSRKLYASWNGATEVASWQLQAGPSPSSLIAVDPVPRSRLETAFDLPAGATHVARRRARQARGKPLGTSAVIRV